MTRTPWFPASVKPVRRGLYEAQYAGSMPFMFAWNGKHWVFPSGERGLTFGLSQRDRWRGLTEPAKGTK